MNLVALEYGLNCAAKFARASRVARLNSLNLCPTHYFLHLRLKLLRLADLHLLKRPDSHWLSRNCASDRPCEFKPALPHLRLEVRFEAGAQAGLVRSLRPKPEGRG